MPAVVRVQVLQRNLDKLIDRVTRTELLRRAEAVVQEIQNTAPVADGSHSFSDGSEHLRDSFRIGFTTSHGRQVIRIFSTKQNARGESVARLITTGTRPHVISANRADNLRFRWITQGGILVITPSVNHPGTAANNFLERALRIGFHR